MTGMWAGQEVSGDNRVARGPGSLAGTGGNGFGARVGIGFGTRGSLDQVGGAACPTLAGRTEGDGTGRATELAAVGVGGAVASCTRCAPTGSGIGSGTGSTTG